MTITARYSSSRKMRGSADAASSVILVTEMPMSGSPSVASIASGDANFDRTTTTPATNNCNLQVVRPNNPSNYSFSSLTPSICSVDVSGNVTRIANGSGIVAIRTPPNIQSFTRTFSNASTVIADVWTSWAVNSLAAHVSAAILAMIDSRTPGATTQAVLTSSSGGASSPNHVRNVNLFTGALDLSAISVYGTAYASNKFPVVLISPLHVMAGHVGASPGQQLVFKTAGGAYEVRTVVSQAKVAADYGDNYVGLLDAEITTITPMKLLPTTWASYVPSWNQTAYLSTFPVLNKGWTDGDYIRVLSAQRVSAGYATAKSLLLQPPIAAPLQSWSSSIIGGDSNGPVFIPINSQPVLLHCMNFTSGGSFYPSNTAAIQAAMTSLGTGTLTYADLTGFASY